MAGAQSIHANVYATQPLAMFGTKEQLDETVPNIISRKWRTCFGVTEPDAGLNTLGMKTFAKKNSDGTYSVTGQKIWITCASGVEDDLARPDHALGRRQEAQRRIVHVLH